MFEFVVSLIKSRQATMVIQKLLRTSTKLYCHHDFDESLQHQTFMYSAS